MGIDNETVGMAHAGKEILRSGGIDLLVGVEYADHRNFLEQATEFEYFERPDQHHQSALHVGRAGTAEKIAVGCQLVKARRGERIHMSAEDDGQKLRPLIVKDKMVTVFLLPRHLLRESLGHFSGYAAANPVDPGLVGGLAVMLDDILQK